MRKGKGQPRLHPRFFQPLSGLLFFHFLPVRKISHSSKSLSSFQAVICTSGILLSSLQLQAMEGVGVGIQTGVIWIHHYSIESGTQQKCGVGWTVQVTAMDAIGNPLTGYSTPLFLNSSGHAQFFSDPNFTVGTTSVTLTQGRATFYIRDAQTETITLSVSDGPGARGTSALITIAGNAPPKATDDTYSMVTGTTLPIAVPGLLANDTDSDGDVLKAILVSGPAQGILDLRADGSFVYTPPAGFAGAATFTYKVSDGLAESNTVGVTIAVRQANRPPLIESGPVAVPNPAKVGDSIAFAALASDPDGDTLTYTWDFGDGTGGSGPTPGHVYNQAGVYTVHLTVQDGFGGTVTGAILVTIEQGSGDGVSNGPLFVVKSYFWVTFPNPDLSYFDLTGAINPAGLMEAPSGLALNLTVNGFTIGAVALTGKPGGTTLKGSSPTCRAALSRRTGKYKIVIRGAELAGILGLVDQTAFGELEALVGLSLSDGRDLRKSFSNTLTYIFDAQAGRLAVGAHQFRKNKAAQKVLWPAKVSAVEVPGSGHSIALSGFILSPEKGLLLSASSMALWVGEAATIQVGLNGAGFPNALPAGLKSFRMSETSCTISFVTGVLEGTGIPEAGEGAAPQCLLPLRLEFQTSSGPEIFEYTVELLRPGGTSLSWKR